MNRFSVPFILLAALVAGAAAPAGKQARDPRPDVVLQSAVKAETIDGDLKKAIELYTTLVDAGDRRVAAQALLGMGRCYEKLGDAEARKAYERLVREFADLRDAAGQARARLAALDGSRPKTMAARKVADVSTWGEFGYPALSPDGRQLAFADYLHKRVTIRDLRTGEERQLPPPPAPPGAVALALGFSPDGRQLASAWIDFAKINPAPPFSPEQIASTLLVSDGDSLRSHTVWSGFGAPNQMSWLSDGRRILMAFTDLKEKKFTFRAIGAGDGQVQPVAAALDVGTTDGFAISPDGRYLAHLRTNEQPADTSALLVRDVETGADTQVAARVRGDIRPAWTPDAGTLLYVDGRAGTGDLWMVQLANGRPREAARMVKADIGDVTPMGITREGVFCYRARTTMVATQIGAFDAATAKAAAAPADVLLPRKGGGCGHDWAADGLAFVYGARAVTNSGDGCTLLVVHTLADHRERLVSTDLSAFRHPRLSPDGRFALVFGTRGEKVYGTYRVDMMTGATVLLASDAFGEWAPDGKGIYLGMTRNRVHRVVYRDLETGTETERYRRGDVVGVLYDDFAAAPDGSLSLLIVRDGTGAREAVVVPPGGQARAVMTTTLPDTMSCIAWSSDGKALWVVRRKVDKPAARELVRVPVDGSQPLTTGLVADIDSLRAHPDGRRLLFTSARTVAEIWTLENFMPPAK
jgi:hypothetical protein